MTCNIKLEWICEICDIHYTELENDVIPYYDLIAVPPTVPGYENYDWEWIKNLEDPRGNSYKFACPCCVANIDKYVKQLEECTIYLEKDKAKKIKIVK
jgi:hypothetical protein